MTTFLFAAHRRFWKTEAGNESGTERAHQILSGTGMELTGS